MNASAIDIYGLIVLLSIALIVLGFRTYIAWFFPDEHAEYVAYQISTSWITSAEPNSPSLFIVRLFKYLFTLFFFLLALGFFWVIATRF